MADRESHHRAQACRQRAGQLEALAMAESYPERRKHFFDLATAYRNAANMADPPSSLTFSKTPRAVPILCSIPLPAAAQQLLPPKKLVARPVRWRSIQPMRT